MGKNENAGWLVFGHYGGSNTGDEAMLLGLIDQYLKDGQRPLSIIYQGIVPLSLQQNGVRFIQPNTWLVLKNIIKSHGIIVGGGTHFQDDYNGARAVRHYRYMLRFVGVSFLAKLFKKRVIWLSLGFGPFLRAPVRWITRLGLKFPDHVTVRDSQSMKDISRWIHPDKIQQCFDLAALLVGNTDLNLPRKAEGDNNSKILGISVTPAARSKTLSGRADGIFWDNFMEALQEVYRDSPCLQIKVFTFRGGQRESDVEISSRLYRSLAEIDARRVAVIPYQPDPYNILKEISACDTFIATRYHSGVLAYLAECKLLILAYHRKLIDLTHEIGLQQHACVPIDGTYSIEDLKGRINHLITRPDQYKASLPVHTAVEMAYQNIDVLKRFETP